MSTHNESATKDQHTHLPAEGLKCVRSLVRAPLRLIASQERSVPRAPRPRDVTSLCFGALVQRPNHLRHPMSAQWFVLSSLSAEHAEISRAWSETVTLSCLLCSSFVRKLHELHTRDLTARTRTSPLSCHLRPTATGQTISDQAWEGLWA